MASGGSHEAHISAQQHQAEAFPWIPRSYEDRRWSQRDSSSSRSRPQASRTDHSDQAVIRLGLPSALRLRKTRDYQRVQRGGRRIRATHILVLYKPGITDASRVGITVSRKVGGAVTRNRVKRCIREAVRMESTKLVGVYDVVIIAHPIAAGVDGAVLHVEVADCLSRVGVQ